ncbi:MAG: hypothetical protein GXO75_17230 [Calditrichaeota bacterium]|nr:hypothetical protein [Calditrichota bacterium]
MKTRFGADTGGRLARTAYAIMAILTLSSFIGYAYQGIGKFASVYISLRPLAQLFSNPFLQNAVLNHQADILAILIISVTSLYVILGRLYSVVFFNLRKVKWHNTQRRDIQLVYSPELETLQTSRLLPPSEAGVMRWDRNLWAAVRGDGCCRTGWGDILGLLGQIRNSRFSNSGGCVGLNSKSFL